MNTKTNDIDSKVLADVSMSLTNKHHSALVILQRCNIPCAIKWDNGNVWVMGRNTAYYQLKTLGYKFDNKKDWWYKNA